MKALVWHENGEIQLKEVADPKVEAPTDAIVRLTTTAVFGTDLRLLGAKGLCSWPAANIAHGGVGVVESLGRQVRNLAEGDRVLIPSSIACGTCHPCRNGWTAQCDHAHRRQRPNGAGAEVDAAHLRNGFLAGLQAEKTRVPFASFNLIKLPDGVSDGQAILISEAFPTGFRGAEMASIQPGNSVAVLGCGPVGLFAVASAKLMGAGRVFAIDSVSERLAQARRLGAETIDYEKEDPVEVVLELTGGTGVDRSIEAAGAGTFREASGFMLWNGSAALDDLGLGALSDGLPADGEEPAVGPKRSTQLSLRWCVEMLAKQGVASIVGSLPSSTDSFPIGLVYSRNLTIRAGLVHHRMVIPRLIDLVVSGRMNPLEVVAPTMETRLDGLEDVYRSFDRRQVGWTKVAVISR